MIQEILLSRDERKPKKSKEIVFKNSSDDTFSSSHCYSDESFGQSLSNTSSMFGSLSDCSLTDEQIVEEIIEMESLLIDSGCGFGSTVTEVVPLTRPVATFDKAFTDMEWQRIRELSEASRVFYEHTNTNSTKYCIEINKVVDMYEKFPNVIDQFIMSTINYCKSITNFKEVCENDKLVLLKSSYWKLLCLTYLPTMDFKLGRWIYAIVSCQNHLV